MPRSVSRSPELVRSKDVTLTSHILTKKTKKQKRNLVGSTLVDRTNLKQVKDLLNLR